MDRRLLHLSFYLLTAGARAQHTDASVPFVLGVSETIHSTVLGEDRMLHIALPQGYHPDSAARYPVIYVLDGGADEDFIHISGLVQFASFPWIEWLPPSIVVGIANVDRKRDFTSPTTNAVDKAEFPTAGGSAAFMLALREELVPFIGSRYRTSDVRMLIGQSLGGLFAAEVLMKDPGLFDRYLIVSPSLWWDDGSLLEVEPGFALHPDQAPKQVYIAVGREGKVMVQRAKKLASIVGKSTTTKVGYSHLKEFDHSNLLHRAVHDGLRWMKEN